jgi:LysM repeat protein
MQRTQISEKPMTPLSVRKAKRNYRRGNIRRADVLVGLLSLVVIIPLVISSGAIIYFQTKQLILPGVYVSEQNVGMMSLVDTTAFIDGFWNQSKQIKVQIPENPQVLYLLSPQDLGLWVDAENTALSAFHVGRLSKPFEDVISALQGDQHLVMPILYYDQSTARQTLEAIQADLTVLPHDARIEYQDGTWVALSGTEGYTLDIEATLDDLYTQAFNIMQTGRISLYPKILSPQVTDLSPVLDQIAQVTAQEFRFRAYDPITDEHLEWLAPIEIVQNWVSVDPTTTEVGLKIKSEDVRNLIEGWEQSLGDSRTFESTPDVDMIVEMWERGQAPSVTIYHAPTTYTVSAGESLWSISLKLGMPMWHIMDANEGLTVNNITAGMVLSIPSKNILLPLPVIPEKRIVVDIGDQTMTVYENGQVRNQHIVSTGMSDSPTMAGIFQIQSHEINAYASNWDLWMPHFLGIYEAWPGFMNGIHGLPLLSGGGRLWASSLGSPASYGCIILDLAAAEDLYFWAEDGVVVEITR